MRDLVHYGAGEWLRLLPLSDAFKQGRNDAWQRVYNATRAEGLDRFLASVSGQHLGIVVAFEQPWALDWLLRMARRNVPGLTLLVCDNSRRMELRAQIAEVCAARGVSYLALPANRTRHVNRSHGMAMNWIYQNVVRPLAPQTFAFIDHDMIPVLPSDRLHRLGGQPVFGLPNTSAWGWNLWAGYCAFDYAYAAPRGPNFLYDFSNDLDTGGRNWQPLYRELDRSRLNLADHRFPEVTDPVSGEKASVQLVDECWFHIGSISYNNNFQGRAQLCQRLAAALDAGASWSELCNPAQGKNSHE